MEDLNSICVTPSLCSSHCSKASGCLPPCFCWRHGGVTLTAPGPRAQLLPEHIILKAPGPLLLREFQPRSPPALPALLSLRKSIIIHKEADLTLSPTTEPNSSWGGGWRLQLSQGQAGLNSFPKHNDSYQWCLAFNPPPQSSKISFTLSSLQPCFSQDPINF